MTGLYGTLGRRYLLGKKFRSLMTLAGIALGVTMVIAVRLTNAAIMSSYETLLESVAGRADLQVTAVAGHGFPAAVLDEVAAAAGVDAAVPSVSSAAPVVAGGRKGMALFYGIDPALDTRIRAYELAAGGMPAAPGEVAVSADLAEGLGLAPGDRLQVLGTRGFAEFTVAGVIDAGGTVRGALGPFGVMALADAQDHFGKAALLDTIDILVAAGHDRDRVLADLERLAAGRARAGTPLERSEDMQSLLDSMLFSLTMAGSVSLFAGAFIIYTNVSMGVAERRRDLSILRALGMRRSEVMRLVLSEAALLGLAGAALGIGWGYGLAATMAAQMTAQFLTAYGVEAAAVAVGAGDLAVALAVGAGVSLISAYAPARETLAVSPVEAMRPAEVRLNGRERHGWLRAALGLALAGAAAGWIRATWPETGMLPPLLLRTWALAAVVALLGVVTFLPVLNRWLLQPLQVLLLGLPGRLASDNLVRQPRRTAATVAALMVSLTFMVGMGGLAVSQRATFDQWFKKSIGWDLNVSTSFVGLTAQVEMDPALVARLAEVPGVRLASPQKMTRIVLSDGDPAFLEVFDHQLLHLYSEPMLEEGRWDEVWPAMTRGGSAIVSGPVARRLGLGIGDSIGLPTPSGEQSFRIIGIMKDITSAGGTVRLDRRDYVAHWQDETATNVAVLVDDPARVEEVRQAIRDRLGGATELIIRSNREFWAEIKGYYDAFYKLMDGLIWISILVSALAIANTLFSNILERRREFGILRAVGTRRGEIIRVVLGEAAGIGLVGGAFGIAAGILLELLFVGASEFIVGNSTDWVFPWVPMATALAVAVGLAPAAGLVPARWSARLDVVDALRYE